MKNILGNKKDLEFYNKDGVMVYEFHTYSDGSYFYEHTYDKNGIILTYKNSDGPFWFKWTRDDEGNELTYENSKGTKRGFDTPEFTMEQLVKKLGNFKLIK